MNDTEHHLRQRAAQVAGYVGPVLVMALAAAAFMVISGMPPAPPSF